jgi:hypothetical protein
VVVRCAHGAYRATRGSFARPQSAKPNGDGIMGCLLLLVAGSLAAQSF